MNQGPSGELRVVWALWAAAGVAAVGGVLPFVFGGPASRIDGVVVPFWAGAIALGLCALLHNQGRTVTATLYFVAGLAIVFGLLEMVSLPVRLAALGSCSAPPAPCTSGLPRPLTDAENNGMGAASTFGIFAILLGFYGLVTLFRRQVIAPSAPPVRTIPAIAPTSPARLEPEPEPAPQPVQAAAAEEPELPLHEEAEVPELPPHESKSPSA